MPVAARPQQPAAAAGSKQHAAGGGAGGGGIVEYLAAQAPRRPVNNSLTLKHYHHSLKLLLGQIDAYRRVGNDEQMYVMLLRYVSMVVETMQAHKDFDRSAPEYRAARQQALSFTEDAERLKAALRARDITAPKAHTVRRPPEAVRIEPDSAAVTLRDIAWDEAGAPLLGGSSGSAAYTAAAASAPPLPPGGASLELSHDLEWWPSAAAAAAAPGAAAAAPAAPSGFAALPPRQQQQQPYSASYMPSSQQTLQKHALYASRSSSWGHAQQQQQPGSSSSGGNRARYPAFDASPIDALWAAPPAAAAAAASSSSDALPDVGSLSLSQQQQLALLHQPSAGPSLGPQELEVQPMQPCHGQPGGTCAMPPPPQQLQLMQPGLESAAEAAAAAAAGPKHLSKRLDLRDVHISMALMNDFLHFAASNTRRGIESCGILAGRLSASDSRFTVTTLIVPKQTGTSDTVEMLGEEEVWEAESSRELVPLGWIHTHPTQTCFLSSVDIHTQCGYQTMLDEAVAIVMAPSDSRRKCGIFRLGTPAGLTHVQRCSMRGFHAGCSSEHYELCGHVYLNPGAKHEVIDLR